MTYDVHIIGGGMAGSEAAWQLARRGLTVRLSEMRGGGDSTAAHQGTGLAELVCSNSFRSDDHEKNAVGLLHAEMRACQYRAGHRTDSDQGQGANPMIDSHVVGSLRCRAMRREE